MVALNNRIHGSAKGFIGEWGVSTLLASKRADKGEEGRFSGRHTKAPHLAGYKP